MLLQLDCPIVNSELINHSLDTYSLVPRLWEKQPGNFCEFKLYTDVTSQQLQYLIQPVHTSLARVILTIFPAVRMGLSCSWKQLFAVGSTTEVK